MIEAIHLRQNIIDHPDDDGPRLVFADWLEERGECARAELIRLGCAVASFKPCTGDTQSITGHKRCKPPYCLACRPFGGTKNKLKHEHSLRIREVELVNLHGVAFLKMELPKLIPEPVLSAHCSNGISDLHGMKFEFKRGMIEEVTMTPAQITDNLHAMKQYHPLRLVSIVNWRRSAGYYRTNQQSRALRMLQHFANSFIGIKFEADGLTALVPRTSAESNQPTSGQSAPAAPPRADEPVPASLSAAH